MKYYVNGFNQTKIMKVQYTENDKVIKVDTVDLEILNWLMYATSSTSLDMIEEDGTILVWCSRSKLVEDLPILNLNERKVSWRLDKLKKLGLITTKQMYNSTLKGSRLYVGRTDLFNQCLYGADVQHDRESKLQHNSNSYNILNNTNSISNISKDTLDIQPKVDTTKKSTRTLFNTKSTDSSKSTTKQKLKPYDKCILAIEEFTDNEELRKELKNYLGIRLGMKDKPLKLPGGWISILNSIPRLSTNVDIQIFLVNYASIRGWAGVFIPKGYDVNTGKFNNYFNNSGKKDTIHLDSDYVRQNKQADDEEQDKRETLVREERLKNGEQVEF